MSEAEWLQAIPSLMLQHVAQTAPATHRKLRLLAVAFGRYLETLPDYSDAMHVSHLGEEIVEGLRTLDELWDDRMRGWGHDGDWRIANLVLAGDDQIDQAIRRAIVHSEPDSEVFESGLSKRWEIARRYLFCIVGNPFHPAVFDPSWRTSTVVALAEAIYADRAFDRLPILADALEDSGCDQPDVLAHCRGNGPHARGCWVVDLVLGKP